MLLAAAAAAQTPDPRGVGRYFTQPPGMGAVTGPWLVMKGTPRYTHTPPGGGSRGHTAVQEVWSEEGVGHCVAGQYRLLPTVVAVDTCCTALHRAHQRPPAGREQSSQTACAWG